MRTRKLMLAALGCLLLWTVTAAAATARKEHALKVGKKGEITLTQQTKVGNIVLQPDTYVVQHRVSGGNHRVCLTVAGSEEIPWSMSCARYRSRLLIF
jgi:hypothetical protein